MRNKKFGLRHIFNLHALVKIHIFPTFLNMLLKGSFFLKIFGNLL